MTVTFLGTGTSQGVPVIACDCEVCRSLDFRDKRTRSSIHISTAGQSLVIDTGPDFRTQILRERIKHLDAVIFTHEHKDHTAGMDDVRSFNFAQRMNMPIYGTHQVIAQLKKEFSYVFADVKYPGVPTVDVHEIANAPFEINGVKVTPIEVQHYRLPVLGFRFADFTYITDAKEIAKKEIAKIKGSKVLVLNALQKEKHLSHFTLTEALDMIHQINPDKAYLTHISHKLGLHKEVEKELPPNVEIAYDGLKVIL